ncbi:glycosyltransferase, family 1 [Campylobacter pinnipediorum subsp. caledonicus]|uniref:Glycosyltransferase, family 1 n=1 Tax=Campylobacter pinnipediorum subsp. caledonicus TaxID=1874362 RepID=A0A1S6U947_9BACT|nr:glycosyltransferase family 4 protein [Campylobacter pinnipediorum]AQW88192.1 glycosyltransferase, family 1 [Campylobacter pinnipediorum subsp. caledonicus]
MKKLTFLRMNPKAVGGAEIYLSRLTQALKNENIRCEIKSLKMPKLISSWIKALIFNKYARFSKKDDIYFSLERIDSADIYRAGDGVHKVYMKSKKFWFSNPLNFVYPYLEKKCFTNSKLIIANSNFIKKQIVDTYDIKNEKIKVIYNGVKLQDDFDKNEFKQAICKELNIDIKTPIILFVGSGFKRKGVDVFLNMLSKMDQNFNAIIIGKDKKLNNYKSKSKELGLENKVFFMGARKDVDRYYKASDIFIFPTKYEPFSNVVLEALSFKNVVFTTSSNGASEILSEKFVIKNDDFIQNIKFINKLLADKDLLQKEQNSSFELVKNFSIEKNAKETISAIKSIVK